MKSIISFSIVLACIAGVYAAVHCTKAQVPSKTPTDADNSALSAFLTEWVPHPPTAEQKREFQNWVEKCLTDFDSIKIGMTREEIGRRLWRDGGIQTPSLARYLLPACGDFKIDVEFQVKTNPADQNRAVSSKDDKAVRISKPYIELPCSD